MRWPWKKKHETTPIAVTPLEQSTEKVFILKTKSVGPTGVFIPRYKKDPVKDIVNETPE